MPLCILRDEVPFRAGKSDPCAPSVTFPARPTLSLVEKDRKQNNDDHRDDNADDKGEAVILFLLFADLLLFFVLNGLFCSAHSSLSVLSSLDMVVCTACGGVQRDVGA